ncbi:general secretion pathway protein K [Persephonella hydrogeniphila]|uniref:General secretion pathway protein K n=1 Tax=Persephonella hydrogeniphila TaxID=198703 RepID=A0A285NAH9_9AQUI|nr:type II secretion system protein GspK [Persephonella hydrogeniphila]SNZ06475.1 general secretion pathway protein K [Persephonella hydrogeniphila]
MILLFVFIVIASIGTAVLDTTEDRYLLENYVEDSVNTQQILLISDSISEALIKVLNKDDKSVDYIGEFWSKNIPLALENVKVEVQIVDQERFLNPNRVITGEKIDKKFFGILERLFDTVQINNQILYNIIDWIDADSFSNGGKEDYRLYPAKNSYIDTVEEFLLIDGVDSKVFNGKIINGRFFPGLKSVLSPYSNGKVNINTASKWVLMALDEEIDSSLASKIISYRKEKPFKNVDELVLIDGFSSDILYRIRLYIDVKSENFLADVGITFGGRKYKLVILLNRKNKTKVVWKKIQ